MNIRTSKLIIGFLTLFITISSQAAPTAANFTHAEICKGTSFQGSLTGLASGGTPPYISYSISTAVNQGTLSLTAATGLFTYTAAANPTLTAPTFQWRVKDSAPTNATSNAGVYTILVGYTVSAQTVRGCAGATITGTLSATAGTAPYTFAIVTNPTKGVVNLTGTNNATFTYVPNSPPAFTSDSFVFNAIDAAGCASNANATVTIQSGTVTGNATLNAICTGSSISSTVSGRTTQGVAPFTYAIVTSPSQGTLTLDPSFTGNGNFTYTPNSPFSGLNDTFTYTATDTNGCISNTATITIPVNLAFCNGLNCPNPLSFTQIIACPGVASVGTITLIDTGGAAGGTPPYNYTLLTTPAQGTLLLDANFTYNGNFTYTPNSPFLGTTDVFTYTAHDAAGCLSNNIGQQIITVGIVPTPLTFSGICSGTSFTGTLFQAVAGGVGPYRYSITSNPLQGILTFDPNFINNGIFTYTPNTNFAGSVDTFAYRITDNVTCMSNPATVTLQLSNFVSSGNITASVCPGVTLLGNLATLFSGGVPPYTFTQVTGPTQGTLSLSGNGNFTYTPNVTFIGSQDSFQFTFTDFAGCASTTQTLLIPIGFLINDSTTPSVCPGNTLSSNLSTFNIARLTGIPPYTYQIITNVSEGVLNLNATGGNFTYTPNSTFDGPFDSFTYRIVDVNNCSSNIATVTIPIELFPVVDQELSSICIGSLLTGTVTGNTTGGTGPYTFTLVQAPVNGTLSIDNSFATSGKYTYITSSNFTATSDAFAYAVIDSFGCRSNNITVTIPLKTSPTSSPPSTQIQCSGQTTTNTLAGLATGGVGPYTYSIVNQPAHGTLTLLSGFSANGNYSYTSTQPYGGPDCFTFQATDSNGCITPITPVGITVHANPVATNSPIQPICSGRTLTNTLATLVSGGLLPYVFSIITPPANGTLTLLSGFTANGNYSYVSTGSYTGPDSFTYQVTDANACLSNIATVLISVNANPVATNTTVAGTCQGVATSGSIVSAVSGGVSSYTFSLVSGPAQAQSFSLSGNGTYNYTPNATFAGPSDSFAFRATDQNGCISNTAIITIPILANPTSSNKTISAVCQGTVIQSTVGSVAGGTPPYNYTIVTGPTFGSAALVSPTSPTFNYSGSSSFTGPTDSFTFQVSDANGCISNISTVTIPINPSPLASNKTEPSICQGKSLSDNLSPLATGGSGSYTSFSIMSSPIHGGTIILNATSGAFTFTAASSYTGPADSFTFTVTDSAGCSSTSGTITVPISPNPIAANGATTIISPGGSITGTVAPFVSSGTPPYSFTALSGVTQGTLTLGPTFISAGNFSYTANISATGFDSFTYRAFDSAGCQSNVATLVLPFTNSPLAQNATEPAICQGTSETLSLIGLASGGVPPYSFTINSGPSFGTLSLTGFTGMYSYSAASGFSGPDDSFTYFAVDNLGSNSNIATITLPINSNPVTINKTFSPGVCASGTLTSSISNLVSAGTPLYTFNLITGPTHALSFSLSSNGNFSYTPNVTFLGTDNFTFDVIDNNGCISNSSIVTIPIATSPTANGFTTATTCQGGTITQNLISFATGGSGTYTFSVTTPSTHGGTVTITNPTAGTFVYQANGSFTGASDTFTYQATDANGCASNSATVTVPLEASPVISSFATTAICQGGSISDATSATGGTPPYTFTIVSGPSHGGSVVISPTSGVFTYSATASFTGPADTFTYSVSDTPGCTASPATVTIPIHEDPLAANLSVLSACDGAIFTGSLTGGASGGQPPYTYASDNFSVQGAAITLNPNTGTYTYSGIPSFTGLDSFTYSITDFNNCTSTSATVTVLVNSNPTSSNFTAAPICQGGTVSGSVSSLVTGGAPPYTYAVVTPPSHLASFAFTSSGNYTYTADPAYPGPNDSFTFAATDQNGCISNAGTITFVITAAPQAENFTTPGVCQGLSTSGDLSLITSGGVPPYTYILVSGPTHAANFSLDSSTGIFDYEGELSFAGPSDSFTFQVEGNDGCISIVYTVTIPIITAPFGIDATISAVKGQTTTGHLQAINGVPPYTFAAALPNPTQGTVTILADGTFFYTANLSAVGTDSFGFSVSDSSPCAKTRAPYGGIITVIIIDNVPLANFITGLLGDSCPL